MNRKAGSGGAGIMTGLAFEAFCAYLRRVSGLVIDADKAYLVESRLLPILRRQKLSGLAELVCLLERNQSPALAREVIQAMTINETYFFRDRAPFETFRNVMLPKLTAGRTGGTIRVWSAACSTGQEPYSLAIILDELAEKLADWRIEILATDLAEAALVKAKKGAYTQFEVQRGLTTAQLLRYFNRTGDMWQLNERIRARVTFKPFNLLDDFGPLGRFHIIFCRNVLLYFDAERKADVLARLARALESGGYLALGASETAIGLETGLVFDAEHRCFIKCPGEPVSARCPTQ